MKAFATTTFIFDIRILKFKAFIEALFDIIQFGAVEIEQTLRVDYQLYIATVKHLVFSFSAIDKFKNVGKTRTASGANAQSDANTF